jgi:hypothetical protein
MNALKSWETAQKTGNKKPFFKGKIKDLLIVGGLAIALVFASWKVFYDNKDTTALSVSGKTQTEEKIGALLEEITGVGEADVVICETEEGVQSVVVVCDGANDLQVVLNVRQAVAAALGTNEKAVKIYQKKE